MDNVNPIMVGRNAPAQETAPVNPLQQQMAALAAAPTAQAAPVAAAPAPVAAAPAPVQAAVQQAGGCAMYFNVKTVTKLVLEMPWGFINKELDCAFISNMGELVVCDLPPMYDANNDVFVLDPTATSLVLGSVAPEHSVHWRDSVSFRPDSGYSDEDVELLEEKKVEETKVVEKLVDNTDYSHLSRNQRKRVKKKKLASGIKLEDLPESLRTA